jgi:hypothetical protein
MLLLVLRARSFWLDPQKFGQLISRGSFQIELVGLAKQP